MIDELFGFALLTSSIIVIAVYGYYGRKLRIYAKGMSENYNDPQISYVRDISNLMFTVVAFVGFWLLNVVLTDLVQAYIALQVIDLLAYVVLCGAAVIGLLRFWKRMVVNAGKPSQSDKEN